MKKIAVVPIDNRPICYTLVEQICAIHKGIKLFLPPRDMLGGLVEPSDIDGILGWLEGLPQIDYIILSLDTIAYGGLVNSRRCPENYDEILERVKRLEEILARFKKSGAKVYAFSSIMRISNNNINEEEKLYWSEFGKRIFEYSYNSHKYANAVNVIPADILSDYLATRERNFKINKYYLKLAQRRVVDTLVYSKDDTGEFGLNVQEAKALEKLAGKNIFIKTGADEIPLTLLARAITDDKKISARPIFLNPTGAAKISKYEDITLDECVKSQLSLAGVDILDSGADLNFIINNFNDVQGDLVLGEANSAGQADFERFDNSGPYFIADVNNANGADFGFIEEFLARRTGHGENKNFYGYCAYNTSANSIGCAICTAVTKFFAVRAGQYDDIAFKKLMLVRFLDDWAYQAKIRRKVREEGQKENRFDISSYKKEFTPFEQKICAFLGVRTGAYGKIDYELPWKRSFEIEIKFESEE